MTGIMHIAVNDLLKWEIGEDSITERVLWIDEDNIHAFTIDIFATKGFPLFKRISDIIEDIEMGRAEKLRKDPYAVLILEDEISTQAKQARDKNWKIISSLVENEPNIYYRHYRGPVVKRVVQEKEVTYKTVYFNLRRYWQRGKTINALIPDDYKKGGKGKEKSVGTKKRGRPRKYLENQGINVDESTKKIFRTAIKKYYETHKSNTLEFAYKSMLRDFYSEDYRFENGIKKPILMPPDQIPTIEQFRYWYLKEQNISHSIISRKGKKEYELNHRPVLGSSTKEVIGPGSRYQIDATVGDVYLVSRYNRQWIIGRPVIYLLIDVYSRMVTGVYVGLEGPSWLGAKMAIANAATDKVQFCKEYDIDIISEKWPCYHVPDVILADRGELEAPLVESFAKALNVRIENAPPYRADWKGIVERYFKTVTTKVKPLVPGYIDIDFRKRGGTDYRLDAKLDIYQFTKIIILNILSNNCNHWMEKYNREEMLIGDDVPPIPIELWNWGIENRSGSLRTFPEDIVKLNLMPQHKVRITSQGIQFKSWAYSCDKALREHWFDKARNKGSWKMNACYDPRNMNHIYLRSEDGRSFEKCNLLETHSNLYDKTLEEITHCLTVEKKAKENNKMRQLQKESDLRSEINEIVNKAKAMTEAEQDKHASKLSRTSGIKDNRKFEKDINRKSESFELDAKEKAGKTDIVPFTKESKKDEKKPLKPDYTDIIEKDIEEWLDDEE